MSVRLIAAAAVCLAGVTAPAAGQAPSQPRQDQAGDPNERICEDIKTLGSRLAKKRFCGTRAEWADKKLQDKQEVERIQRSPCVYTHNGGNGKPAC
jgi:hypothetical protein